MINLSALDVLSAGFTTLWAVASAVTVLICAFVFLRLKKPVVKPMIIFFGVNVVIWFVSMCEASQLELIFDNSQKYVSKARELGKAPAPAAEFWVENFDRIYESLAKHGDLSEFQKYSKQLNDVGESGVHDEKTIKHIASLAHICFDDNASYIDKPLSFYPPIQSEIKNAWLEASMRSVVTHTDACSIYALESIIK